MSRSDQKIVQYLKEARASELALVRVLQSQIAMTPRGTYRSGLETHLQETREHAKAVGARSRELSHGFNPIALAFGVTEAVVGQALALSKTPLDLVRGTGGEEKVLKNAKDSAAAETLEIATYTALERLAERAGDTTTAALAARIRGEEERMLDRLLAIIPELTDAVYAAEVGGSPTYDPKTTGAADAVRGAAGAAKDAASKVKAEATDAAESATAKAKRTAADVREVADDAVEAVEQQARDAAGAVAERVEDAADEVKSAAEDAQDKAEDAKQEPTPDEDTSTAAAPPVAAPGTPAPWASYDESTDEEILAVLLTADQETLVEVGAYERAHEARKSILGNVDRRTPTAS